MVRIGGLHESPEAVLTRARAYLGSRDTQTPDAQTRDAQPPFAYPWYDSYDTGAAETVLVDGDLLAPLLLHAAPDLVAYRTLYGWRDALEAGLRNVAKVAAGGYEGPEWPEMDQAIGELYQPLDDRRGGQLSGTTLSKVLHRKMPAYIPLYDSKIFWLYCSAPVVRIAPHPDRKLTWVDFMSVFAREIRRDMGEPDAVELINEVRKLAADTHPVTELRAWDIIAWQAARNALLTTTPPEHADDDTI
jgi:hypothetical protein